MDTPTLQDQLKKLKLTQMAMNLSQISKSHREKNHSLEESLEALVKLELQSREETKVNKLIKKSNSPVPKLLSTYDLKQREGITQQDLDELAKGDWVRQGSNVVLYGGFGVGKTHIALGTTRALCQKGLSCYFTTTSKLMNLLLEEKHHQRLSKIERQLDKYDLIVCDELGIVSATDEGSELFFQLIAQRYERKSLLFTSNLTFSEWDKIFLKPLVTQAAVDRILHHCQTFHIKGSSQREEDARRKKEKLTRKT